MAVELATGYVSIVPDTRRVAGELRRAMQQAGGPAGRQGGEAAGAGIGDAIGELGGKGGPIGAAVAAAFALAGFTAAGLLVKGIKSGLEREKALDMTQARLGVDEATMHKIGFAAGRAYVGAFGGSVEENIDTARRAIQSGLLDPNATAAETQKVISQISGISDMMGEEIPAVARAAGQAVRTGMAADAGGAMDLFAAATRNGLNVSEDFLDTVTEYGTQFRKLGLSGPEAIGLINQAVKAGARDTDVAADAIKEFSIRVVDGSKSTTEAFQELGFSSDDLAARFAAGGETARAATGELLARIREIEDPVKKNEVALALFGTQFEDLGDALNNFNLDTAVNSLGQVAGAADAALNTMGGNAASKMESAKRSIEVTLDELGGALAQAFGPGLGKLADWVTTHQPEILGFLGKLVDAAFAGADALLAFASSSLRGLASFADGAGSALSAVLDPLGGITEAFGELTGNDKMAAIGAQLQDMDTKFHGAADAARGLADTIDTTGRPALERLGNSIGANIQRSVDAQVVFRALGEEVAAVPTEKGILVHSNSPEVKARLEELGLAVQTLPNGQMEVTANTAEGQRIIDSFIVTNTGREIPVTMRTIIDSGAAGGFMRNAFADRPGRANGGVVPGYAGGGVAGRTIEGLLYGPGTATSDSILGIDARGVPTARVSAGEGVVKVSAMQRGGAELVAALNGGWVPPVEFLREMVRGGARLAHGDYDGTLNRVGITEDSQLVAAVLGLRSLLHKGDYTSNLRDAFGVEEDHPLVSAALGGHSLLARGDYDGRLRAFGIEEDNPLVDAAIGGGALLRGDYRGNLRRFGINEDHPLVDAGIGLGGLMRGDYLGNLRRFGLEEDNPLVGAFLNTRSWLASLPGYAGGGVVDRAKAMAQSAAGSPYQYGGVGNPSWDCSGIQSDLYAVLTGQPTGVRHFTTETNFEDLGFLPGPGGPNDYSIGVLRGGGGPNSHMAGTLPGGLNVESSGAEGVEVGGGAQGASDFPLQWHLPLGGDPGGQIGGGGGGAVAPLGGGGAGLGGGGARGGAGAGASVGGGTFGGVEVPAGVTPVWVVNLGQGQALEAAPAAEFTPEAASTATASTLAAPGPAVDQDQTDWGARAREAGEGFLTANADQLLSDLGLRRSGGAIQALVGAIFDAVSNAAAQEVRKNAAAQATAASRYSGRA